MSDATSIVIDVVGIPKGEPKTKSTVFTPQPGKPMSRIYTPNTAAVWRAQVSEAAVKARPSEPFIGPVRVDWTARFPRPGDHYRTGKHAGELRESAPWLHRGLPDRDNVDKTILDALQEAGYFRNDSQAAIGLLVKRWCRPGELAGCTITVAPLEDSEPPTNERCTQ